MSAVITLVITQPNATVTNLNGHSKPTKPHETVNSLIDYLAGISGGLYPATVQVVTRATDPGVTTDSDPNSTSTTYTLL